MRPFRVVLEHPVYWTLNRRNVTRAFALGLFIAFVPIPIHMLLAALLALALRLNVPAAMLGTLLTNPITIVPIFVSAYWLGCQLLGLGVAPIPFEMSWDWLRTYFVPVWRPLLLGCFILGAFTAAAGYAALGGLWHVSVVMKYHRRRAGNATKTDAGAQKSECGASTGGARARADLPER